MNTTIFGIVGLVFWSNNIYWNSFVTDKNVSKGIARRGSCENRNGRN